MLDVILFFCVCVCGLVLCSILLFLSVNFLLFLFFNVCARFF